MQQCVAVLMEERAGALTLPHKGLLQTRRTYQFGAKTDFHQFRQVGLGMFRAAQPSRGLGELGDTSL
ncbi:hypothetical protein ANI02nite_33330 [Acetobacter nitrogenifigens DSM 23921 = NBRC 105050]|uniref:Uncharacterized protein n=1 Tax=Acetobacter nitrogenifigens DSM 23921 = NBRC 105050 TaxID=1120919 RepID=A0A511XER2_9PROT|nr:hypothetical protein ANI02nite_33330 [Acetobacter nitrogenifigens DSM 23921 = NBRC 105050]